MTILNFMGEPISAKECLAATLRYLVTGDEKQTIQFSYQLGFSTLIIPEICEVLWDTISEDYLKVPFSFIQI